MEKLIVIGSNSFSGSSFIQFLLKNKNFEVIGLSRSREPTDALLPYKWIDHKNFKFEQLDLNQDLPQIENLIHEFKPQFVVNFAAQSMVGESWLNPSDWFMTNCVSTIKFHDMLRKCDFLKRYVHITTPEVYGSCSGFVKEEHAFNPSTPYAVSRAACDMSLKTFYDAYNFPVVSTRAANVYGPGQQLYRIIPRTILFILLGKKIQLHGGGASTRSFIHINDVSEATLKIMVDGKNGNTYHISTPNVISIRDLVENICIKLGASFDASVEIVGERLGKDSAYHLDSTKVRSELGWEDKISLDIGLEECIKWVQQNLDELKLQSFNYLHKA
jgi:dTDP-glucose 4,6-dehydratase